MQNIKIQKGRVLIYRVFDVGDEIFLNVAEKELLKEEVSRLNLKLKVKRTIIIKQSPIKVNFGEDEIEIGGKNYTVFVSAKIWDYGVISITLSINLSNMDWKKVIILSQEIEDSEEVDELSLKVMNSLKSKIIKAVQSPSDWEIFEDYTTFLIEKAENINSPSELIEKADIPALIMSESENNLSSYSRHEALKHILQYSENDMAIIDWNSALLFEPEGEMDVANVIEFSLTHLLELRYYEEGITRKLDSLYESLGEKRPMLLTLFKSKYGEIAEEASHKYIEFSEFLDRVENSLKTVGDPYLAMIFRAAFEEFRFDD